MQWEIFALAVAVAIVGVAGMSTTTRTFSTTTTGTTTASTTNWSTKSTTRPTKPTTQATEPPKTYKKKDGFRTCWSCLWENSKKYYYDGANCKKPSKELTHYTTCEHKDEVCAVFDSQGKGLWVRSCLKPEKCDAVPNGGKCFYCTGDLCLPHGE